MVKKSLTRWWKKFEDMYNHLDRIYRSVRQTDILPQQSALYAYTSSGKNCRLRGLMQVVSYYLFWQLYLFPYNQVLYLHKTSGGIKEGVWAWVTDIPQCGPGWSLRQSPPQADTFWRHFSFFWQWQCMHLYSLYSNGATPTDVLNTGGRDIWVLRFSVSAGDKYQLHLGCYLAQAVLRVLITSAGDICSISGSNLRHSYNNNLTISCTNFSHYCSWYFSLKRDIMVYNFVLGNFRAVIARANEVPTHKFVCPQTEAQEYGWITQPLVGYSPSN